MSTNAVCNATLIATLKDTVRSLGPPDSPVAARCEAEELLEVVGLLQLEIEQRVHTVDLSGEAKAAGYASTGAWLRSNGRMAKSTAGGLRSNGREFDRLPGTVAALRGGEISHEMAAAIANAVKPLPMEADVAGTEQSLLNLARTGGATVEDIGRVGKYLRNVLDPDGSLRDDEKAYLNRYLTAHQEHDGGISGSYYLPPEAAARWQAVLDKYAGPATVGDTRTQSQRNADAFTQLLAGQVHTELLVLVNAEPDQTTPGQLLPTGHPYPAAHLDRLATTSTLYRMVIDANSKVLDLGDGTRLVPGWMRRAILALYPTCAYDDCPVQATHRQTDHVHDWSHHHRTRLDEIVPGLQLPQPRPRRPSKQIHHHQTQRRTMAPPKPTQPATPLTNVLVLGDQGVDVRRDVVDQLIQQPTEPFRVGLRPAGDRFAYPAAKDGVIPVDQLRALDGELEPGHPTVVRVHRLLDQATLGEFLEVSGDVRPLDLQRLGDLLDARRVLGLPDDAENLQSGALQSDARLVAGEFRQRGSPECLQQPIARLEHPHVVDARRSHRISSLTIT
jgi:Domain of unknown function (DUF222)